MPAISGPRLTHPLGYANFTIKPIVECFPTIFIHLLHSKCAPSYLVMQKILVTYSIVASCHGKKYHFCLQTTQPPHYIVRMSCASHQNHHILLARTNHHCFLVLYFCTNLSGWVMSFSNFYYEYHYILFMKLSVAILYLICFSYHIYVSCVRTRRTDFSQNMAVIYSSELTPYFISQPHIHFLHISIIAMWRFCTATTHFIFITHTVHRTSIFLPSYINFCMLAHKSSHRCRHCHHTYFMFTTKQSILASFITRIVAKNILHAHYAAKLQTFLLDIANFY